MKTQNLGKRLLSLLLTLAMVVSLFAALGITSTAASNWQVKTYLATAEYVNGTESTAKTIETQNYSHNYNTVTDYHSGYVTAVSSFDKADGSERYMFRQWKSTAVFYAGTSAAADETVTTPTNSTFNYDFYSGYSLGTAVVDGAIYDTYYRITVNNATQTVDYVKYNNPYVLPVYNGVIPDGQTFVAWKDVDTGLLYAEGANIYPDSAREYSPLFADIDDLKGYFVYFKDFTTGQIYSIKYYEPGKTTLITAKAPVKEGYTFDCWYMEDSEFDAEVVVPIESPDKSVFYARWIPNLYNIDITSQVSGNAFVNISSTTAGFNTTVTFTVGDSKANENIIGVEVLGAERNRYYAYAYDDDTGIYSFTMPAEDVIIRVDTSIDEYAVIFLDENNDFLASRSVLKGETLGAAMPIVPFKAGYYFDKWIVSGDAGGYELTDTTPIYGNLVVKATYIGYEFSIIKAADCDDELEYLYVRSSIQDKDLTDPVTTYVAAKAGDKVYIDVAPTPTYNITGVAVREVGTGDFVVAPTLMKKYKDASNNDCYTFAFEMPISDIEIAVYVAPNTYDVIVDENVDENGTYRINGVDTTNLAVPQGSLASIVIIPAKGYYIDDVSSFYYDENNNKAFPTENFYDNNDGSFTYEFDMVSSDVYVSIKYAPFDYSVNVTASNSDSFKPVWNGDEYVVVESTDDAKTSKGLVTLCDKLGTPYLDWVSLGEPTKYCLIPVDYTMSNIGDQICFKVTEYTGYDLAEVIVTYADGTKTCPTTLKNGIYYFTMPDDDVVIRAYFVEETYKVIKTTASEEYNTGAEYEVLGEVNINGLRETKVSADYKETVTVTAAPKAGYYVETISYALKDGTNKDGKTVVDFSDGINYAGTKLTDTADTVRSIQFVMPACDVDISVTYGKIDYSVETEVTSGDATGTITVSAVNTYKNSVTFTLAPSYGYVLDSFKIENLATGKIIPSIASKINQTYGADYTFDMPASKVKITAKYVKDAYTVTYLDTNNAYIGSEAIEYKDTATLYPSVVSVPNGYHFVGWVSNDTETPVTVASLNTADFVIVKNTVITAVYEKDQTDVIFAATTNGYLAPADSAETTAGGDVTVGKYYLDTVSFDIVPDEGYIVDTIKVYGKDTTFDKNVNIEYDYSALTGKCSFVIPAIGKTAPNTVKTYPVNVVVTFKKDTFNLTKDVIGQNGTVEVNGKVSTDDTYTYEYLDVVTITATPDKGYYVKSIVATMVSPATSTEDTASAYSYTYAGTMPAAGVDGAAQTIKFPMPATDMTFTVVFEKCLYNITTVSKATTPGTHGTVSVNPANTAKVGDLIEVVADPDDGYAFSEISVVDENGNPITLNFVSLGLDYVKKYNFTMPAANVTVTVVFKQIASREYVDVRDDAWYYDAINFVSDRGYFKGYGAAGEIFGPNDRIARQDFVLVIARMNGVDLSAYENVSLPFVDVQKGSYYASAIAWAVEKGIITGYQDGSNRFGVGDSIIRQDIVTILYRYAKFMNYQTDLSVDAITQRDMRYSQYVDLYCVGSYAKEAMEWGVGYGVLKGTSVNTLAPLNTALRSEVAQMLKNMFDHNIAR